MTTTRTHPDGILYFFQGQLLYERRSPQGAVIRKCISAQDARLAFTNQPIDSGWLSPQTIRCGVNAHGNWLLQRYAPTSYTLLLNQPLTLPDNPTPCHQLKVPLPGLLFLGWGKHYFLWAYRTWNGPRTKLYQAPLPNIYAHGRICFGNTKVPAAHADTIEKAWNLVWLTDFNQDLRTDKSKEYPDNIYERLIALHQAQTNQPVQFPGTDLVPSQVTLDAIITTLTQADRTTSGEIDL